MFIRSTHPKSLKRIRYKDFFGMIDVFLKFEILRV